MNWTACLLGRTTAVTNADTFKQSPLFMRELLESAGVKSRQNLIHSLVFFLFECLLTSPSLFAPSFEPP